MIIIWRGDSFWKFESYSAYSEAREIAYKIAKNNGRKKPNPDDIDEACREVGTSYSNYVFHRDNEINKKIEVEI